MEITDQLALELISQITGDEFCEDLDCRLNLEAEDGVKRSWHIDPQSDLGIAAEKLGRIYRIAHSMVKSNSCYSVHDDWRLQSAEKVLAGLPSVKMDGPQLRIEE